MFDQLSLPAANNRHSRDPKPLGKRTVSARQRYGVGTKRNRVTDHLGTTLGVDNFEEHVAHGATMTVGQAVTYARADIRAALADVTDTE
jgi:hypothetical protein